VVKLLSTRVRAQLWKLQEAVRASGRERDRLLKLLMSSRELITPDAHHDLWMEFSCADQEYRHAVRNLATFCERHGQLAAYID
jgi:hypothetical protein